MAKKQASAADIAKKAKELKAALRKIDELTGVENGSWVAANQGEVAKFFGVSINTVLGWQKAGMPGRRGLWELDKIAQWLRESGPWKQKTKDESTGNLDRYRDVKAQIALLELEERRGTLVSVGDLKDGLLSLATMLRRLGERLGQQYGSDAALALNETVQEFEKRVASDLNGRQKR